VSESLAWRTETDLRNEMRSGGERRATHSVLDNDKVSIILVRNAEVVEERIRGLSHNHSGEELSTQPGTTSGRDTSLNDSNLQVGTLLAEDVGGRKTARSGTDNDNVGLAVVV
jgi:hypothetical protein